MMLIKNSSGMMGIKLIIDCLLNRGLSSASHTKYFEQLSYDALIVDLTRCLGSPMTRRCGYGLVLYKSSGPGKPL
jgi:hypothetical protein